MAEIKEFKGLLYDSDIVGDMSSVIAPHCHSAEEETIKKFYASHPFNVIRLEYPSSVSEKSDEKYTVAAETLRKWLETGILKADEENCIYVYEQEYIINEQTIKNRGIICCVKLEDKNIISGKTTNYKMYDAYKSDRYNLMRATETEFSSIFSIYRDEDKTVAPLLETSAAPDIDFKDVYDITHRIWRISDSKKITDIKQAFKHKKLVIADGHIRYETAVNYKNKMKSEVVEYSGKESFNYVMMNLMPVTDNAPSVLAVHRIIKNKQGYDSEAVMETISAAFNVEKSYIRDYDCDKIAAKLLSEKENHAIAMFSGKDYYYILTPKNEVPEDVTDAELLHNEILYKIFGVNDENVKKHIAFTTSIYEAEKSVREGEAQYAFYLNPMTASVYFDLNEEGKTLPKRTNSFYPKLMMGIVMNKFDEQEV